MAVNKTIEFFNKLLSERHNDLKVSAEALILELAGDDYEQKRTLAQKTYDLAFTLSSIIPGADVPNWLREVLGCLESYISGRWTGGYFIKQYYKLLPLVLNHQWGLDDEENFALDFDGVFELYRKESRLPELFDKIIALLESIKDSGEIDSLNMMEALAKIVATLKSGKEGSYFSLDGAWKFLMSFASNYLWAELEKVPLLGTAFEALRKTVEETDREMEKLHTSVQQELDRKVKQEIRMFRNTGIGFISYSRQGGLLEVSTPSSADVDIQA
ncbi:MULTISPECIES: hypothetical protein [unclassified Pseudomonas]|uniref:hypothetical protein n=1 Tax=unclassified Pseudomonas TaxID=196821 RepID=UPI001A9EB75B|nr:MULTISPECIES: hypothetical protein [unclassified Pseudomonas]